MTLSRRRQLRLRSLQFGPFYLNHISLVQTTFHHQEQALIRITEQLSAAKQLLIHISLLELSVTADTRIGTFVPDSPATSALRLTK